MPKSTQNLSLLASPLPNNNASENNTTKPILDALACIATHLHSYQGFLKENQGIQLQIGSILQTAEDGASSCKKMHLSTLNEIELKLTETGNKLSEINTKLNNLKTRIINTLDEAKKLSKQELEDEATKFQDEKNLVTKKLGIKETELLGKNKQIQELEQKQENVKQIESKIKENLSKIQNEEEEIDSHIRNTTNTSKTQFLLKILPELIQSYAQILIVNLAFNLITQSKESIWIYSKEGNLLLNKYTKLAKILHQKAKELSKNPHITLADNHAKPGALERVTFQDLGELFLESAKDAKSSLSKTRNNFYYNHQLNTINETLCNIIKHAQGLLHIIDGFYSNDFMSDVSNKYGITYVNTKELMFNESHCINHFENPKSKMFSAWTQHKNLTGLLLFLAYSIAVFFIIRTTIKICLELLSYLNNCKLNQETKNAISSISNEIESLKTSNNNLKENLASHNPQKINDQMSLLIKQEEALSKEISDLKSTASELNNKTKETKLNLEAENAIHPIKTKLELIGTIEEIFKKYQDTLKVIETSNKKLFKLIDTKALNNNLNSIQLEHDQLLTQKSNLKVDYLKALEKIDEDLRKIEEKSNQEIGKLEQKQSANKKNADRELNQIKLKKQQFQQLNPIGENTTQEGAIKVLDSLGLTNQSITFQDLSISNCIERHVGFSEDELEYRILSGTMIKNGVICSGIPVAAASSYSDCATFMIALEQTVRCLQTNLNDIKHKSQKNDTKKMRVFVVHPNPFERSLTVRKDKNSPKLPKYPVNACVVDLEINNEQIEIAHIFPCSTANSNSIT